MKKKNKRIKIRNINDLKMVLKDNTDFLDLNDEVINYLVEKFEINDEIKMKINDALNDDVCYVSNSLIEFIDYFSCEIEIEKCNLELFQVINNINKLTIYRTEFERIITEKENTDEIMSAILEIKNKVSSKINQDDLLKIDFLEDELSRDYLFAKDIELLKKIIIANGRLLKNDLDEDAQCRTVELLIGSSIKLDYIKANKGSIEFYQHMKNNIPRIKRLIKNLHRYILPVKDDNNFIIEHSTSLQDSINIAIASFNGINYKAISGKVNIEGYCVAPELSDQHFKACQVNKLGSVGIGYRRINDSEKKILETISKEIYLNNLPNKGDLILFTKWEPCPSCYYVISQFCNKYPLINFKVKYQKQYG